MQMMDIKAAIRLFDHYASALEVQQILLQQLRDQAKGDPTLTEHVTSQTESLRTSWRNYTIFSIIFSKQLIKQSGLVLLNGGYPEVIAAQNRLHQKVSEVLQFLEKIKQEASPPKPSSATSSGTQAAGSAPTA